MERETEGKRQEEGHMTEPKGRRIVRLRREKRRFADDKGKLSGQDEYLRKEVESQGGSWRGGR